MDTGCCLHSRPHHQRILTLLQNMDGNLLQETQCYFGGGTAIVLSLGEYRESDDIDFMCASEEGYRALRNIAFDKGLAGFFSHSPRQIRDLKSDRYGIRTFVEVDGVAIKMEIVREDRISLSGELNPVWGVPVLSQTDMYAEKLLANADRFADASTASRDIIDLAMMIREWGPIPDEAWTKVKNPYGESVEKSFAKACQLIEKPDYLASCLKKMHMDSCWLDRILAALGIEMKIPEDDHFLVPRS